MEKGYISSFRGFIFNFEQYQSKNSIYVVVIYVKNTLYKLAKRKQLAIMLICLCFLPFSARPQIWKKVGEAVNKVGDKISLKELQRDPVSTSFRDVDKVNTLQISFGENANYLNIHQQPFTEELGFKLEPGFYEAVFDSFCIKAGTYAPTGGSGRFYAPLEGPKADIFETILRAFHDGKVEKGDAQLLFWAIIAKTDFAKMKGRVKATAVKILSTEDLARLSTNALESMAKDELSQLSYKSKAARAIIDAENNLRAKYYQAVNSYAEYEEIAMLAGVEPVVSGWESGKWTKHPDGYYIRYYPNGYARTRTQVYVPEEAGEIHFNAFGDVAVPAHTSSQRLLQSNKPYGDDEWDGGVVIGNPTEDTEQEECQEIISPAIDAIIQEQIVNQNLPGIAVGVVQGGNIIHLKGYGYKTYSEQYPIDVGTDFRWASISKTITAIATLQLQEDGLLSVNDLASDHVSNWPATNNSDSRSNNVTLSDALSNTSGINHYGEGVPGTKDTKFQDSEGNMPSTENYKSEADGFNAEDAVEAFNFSVLDFEPGSQYLYSTYGFSLVGAAVDAVSEDGYVQHVMETIADPLGMTSLKVATGTDWGVDFSDDSGIIDSQSDGNKESVLPGGGWESNICDLAKFARAIKDGTLLNNQNALYTNVQPGNNSYRFGITDNGFRREHGGSHNNLRTLMTVYNQVTGDDFAIVLMIPAEYAGNSRGRIRSEILRQLRGRTLENPPAVDSCDVSQKFDGLDTFHAIWRKTNKDVILRTGLRHDEFYHEYKQLRNQGYACVDFEPYIKENTLRWDGVFKKESGNRAIWRNFNYEDFLAKWYEMKDDGYILIDLETYRVNGNQLWAGLFEKKSGKVAMYRNLSTSDFGEKRTELAEDGYKLIDIEVDVKNNKPRWSGVWIGGEDGKLNRNYTREEFSSLVSNRRNDGFKLLDIESYTINNETLFAGVWEKSSDDELNAIFDFYCDVTSQHDLNSSNNYELIDWERTVGFVIN